ncbi:carboxypeptidase-like regulatory domain-containing protein [Lacihabitans sp. CCS-44]|uniref:carboxypeptidase-like regulatory domain-containing protein n=1 Tax=Lacihabitans sp. CCS-44 TaxID=2487331 RepID=UPI0020CEDC1F|nr:carboxypeptidase-like regulatory domain-containing protein [Lacihabitans sp. CCS-44]MCP9754912.1 carboxypeptidase-like regulatory domain-containing protein [Lacihabitans sp. CCS-44]
MKHGFLLIFSLLTLTTYCQTGNIRGHITNSDKESDLKYVTIYLAHGDTLVKNKGAIPDSSGNFIIDDIPLGQYSLRVQQLGFRDFVLDSLTISNATILTLNLNYPPPCDKRLAKNEKPKCIGGHTDNIIPISYGLPFKRTLRKAKRGKVFLAGCIITRCDPRFYCKLHKRQLQYEN